MYNTSQHYNVGNDDVSFTRNKRVNGRIILSRRKSSFHAKISGPLFTWFTCFDISVASIIMYCQDFSYNFLHAGHVLHLDILRSQIDLKISLCMAI